MVRRAHRTKTSVEGISEIQLAALEALWTEAESAVSRCADANHLGGLAPAVERGRPVSETEGALAPSFDLTVGAQTVSFIDRKVVLVHGTAQDLSRSIDILGMIAELRLPKTTACVFHRNDRA